MRKPVVEYPPELLDDPALPFSERVDRKLARDDMDWEAWQEAYGNVIVLPFGEVSGVAGSGLTGRTGQCERLGLYGLGARSQLRGAQGYRLPGRAPGAAPAAGVHIAGERRRLHDDRLTCCCRRRI